ncbi:MAG: hypothetical protein ACREN7_06830 [Candidatus Dormibacteria bacterium]
MKLVLRPLARPAAEYAHVTKEPIPISLLTYFEVRSFAFPDRPSGERIPVSVRLAAVGHEIHGRLKLISDLVRRLEALDWDVTVVGDEVVVTSELGPEEGWAKLRQVGVADQLLAFLEGGSDVPRDLGQLPAEAPDGAGY